jgi:small-conductance mechanosensitive channel
MPTESDFSIVTNIIDKLIIFFYRPEVRIQVIVIILAFSTAGFLSKSIWFWLEPRLFRMVDSVTYAKTRGVWKFLILITRVSTLPLLGILFLRVASSILQSQGNITGLLTRFTWVFWTILAIQILIPFLYAVFGRTTMRRYHYRLLLPLLFVVIFLQILNNLTDTNELARMVLLELFTNPVTLGALFVATVGLYFWTDIIQVIHDLIYQLLNRFTNVDPGSTKATLTLIRYVLIIAGIVYALSQLELDPTTLAVITGGLSVGVGFGLREILSNFISGIFLLFERSLNPGDVIEMDGELCVVQDLSIRTTTVRTLNNVELVIPNQMFFTSSFQTYTGSDKMVRLPMIINISCDNDIDTVMHLLQQTAQQHQDVLTEPAPSVFFNKFGNNDAEFQLNVWLDTPLKIPTVKSEVRVMVWTVFQENNIDLTFPDMALHFPDKMPAMPVISRSPA